MTLSEQTTDEVLFENSFGMKIMGNHRESTVNSKLQRPEKAEIKMSNLDHDS